MSIESAMLSREHSLEIVPICALRQTEEIVAPQKLAELAAVLSKQGIFPTPVIAARNPVTQTILPLDGNHRRSAGLLCGLHYLPVMFVGWDEFKIDAWHRALSISNPEQLAALFARFNVTESKKSTSVNQAVLFYGGKTYQFGAVKKNKLRQHQITKDFFEALAHFGVPIENIAQVKTETDELKKDPSCLVVELPKFTKNELIETIESGIVLPPKAYRTLLPHGPIRLPVRMAFLQTLNAIPPEHLQAINEKWATELEQILFIPLPYEINVSEDRDRYYDALSVTPLVVNSNADFEILDPHELGKLNPLALKYSIIKIINLQEDVHRRIEILSQALDISISIVKVMGKIDRLCIEGSAMMNLETVFALCVSKTPLEAGIAQILAEREKTLNTIDLSKELL